MIYYIFDNYREKRLYTEKTFLKYYKKFKVVKIIFDDFGNEIRYVVK